MRIVGGQWRGRALIAPPGQRTRPTADRVRQALFDRLMHAPWAGPAVLQGARVLDGFAGTGALGLEALSRGATFATFIERDQAALAALRANVAACRAEAQCRVLATDIMSATVGEACGLVFLDPPYEQPNASDAVAALRRGGWISSRALLMLELARGQPAPEFGSRVAQFSAGAASVYVFEL